ncbi:MAG: LysR family transcriptional regulator [Pseudomonadota bacterium]
MDFRQLRYLLVIADLGSFTKAAEQIPLAQSALSRHMRLLEEELGVKLLIRTGRGVTLTEQGEYLRDRARSVLEQMEDTRRNLAAWYENPAGLVRIGMTPTATLTYAATYLRQLRKHHENITVRLTEGLSATLIEWLHADRLDLAIVFEQTKNSKLVSEVIGYDEMCLVVPPGHPSTEPVSLHDIAEMPLIAPFVKKGIRNRMTEAFSAADLDMDIAYEIDALPAMKDLVRTGAGVSILTRSSVLRDVEIGDVETRTIDSPLMTFAAHLMYSRSAEHSRAARAAADVIKQTASEFLKPTRESISGQ